MPKIYCSYQDCENNENDLCAASAIRLDQNKGCLTYTPYESPPPNGLTPQGDTLTWDEEYFEDDFLDEDDIL